MKRLKTFQSVKYITLYLPQINRAQRVPVQRDPQRQLQLREGRQEEGGAHGLQQDQGQRHISQSQQ